MAGIAGSGLMNICKLPCVIERDIQREDVAVILKEIRDILLRVEMRLMYSPSCSPLPITGATNPYVSVPDIWC